MPDLCATLMVCNMLAMCMQGSHNSLINEIFYNWNHLSYTVSLEALQEVTSRV